MEEIITKDSEIIEPKYQYLWDGSLKESLDIIPAGICKEIDDCRPLLENYYECVVKFQQHPKWCTENVWCNDKLIMTRKKKFGPIQFGKGVQLLEGTPTSAGGSNSYPTPYFLEKYCVLKFTTKGVPILSHYSYKWIISFLSINCKNITHGK